MSKAEQVERLARASVDKALAVGRREFTITKFGRHENGYLHARITINGDGYYVHRRFGSWMAPGNVAGRAVLKEIDALIGGNAIEIKEALQTKARSIERAEKRQTGEPDGELDTAPDGAADA